MSDRSSDDIKQLFGHLGLDPRSYREIREDRPGSTEAARGSQDWSLLNAVKAQIGNPAQTPPPADRIDPPVAERVEASKPPPRIEPVTTAPTNPEADSVVPAPSRHDDLKGSLLSSLRSFELNRISPGTPATPPQLGTEAPPASARAPTPPPPEFVFDDPPSAWDSAQSQDWQVDFGATFEPEPRGPSEPPETASPAPPTVSAPLLQAPPARTVRAEDAGLASTFRRLEAPRPQTNPQLSRLRLNYGLRAEAHGLSAPREASLQDVFARLRRIADGD